MRIVALAGGPVGVEMLDVLDAHGHRPVAVVASHAAGDRRVACPSTVAWCERRDVPWAYWPRLRGAPEPAAWLAGHAPDLLLSLSYDLILPPSLLATAPRAVNVHRGLAPAFRGASSTIWALERGAEEVGVTLHAMVADVDAGAVLAQRRLPVAPELTAAEAIVLVEGAAVALLDAVLDDLVAERLPARAQAAGGEVFGRELPPADLDDVGGPALARRVRARHNPPYPGAGIDVGTRRFTVVEERSAGNAPAFSAGRPATWTANAASAAALLLDALDGPLAVGELVSPVVRHALRARGADVVSYPLDAGLEPDHDALAAVADGRTVLLGWPCGRPPSGRARALAAAAAERVVEDRTQALLDRDPWLGDDALLDLATWTGSLDGAGVVSALIAAPSWAPVDVEDLRRRAADRVAAVEAPAEGLPPGPPSDGLDVVARPLSRTGAREALVDFDAPRARAAMATAAAAYLAELHRWCPFTHWPPGTVAHGFPIVVDDPQRRAAIERALPGQVRRPLAALVDAGPAQARAEALLALPCHAGVTPEHVDAVLAALATVGVDRRGP